MPLIFLSESLGIEIEEIAKIYAPFFNLASKLRKKWHSDLQNSKCICQIRSKASVKIVFRGIGIRKIAILYAVTFRNIFHAA